MIRVLIVDDDKLARKGLISIVPWEECGMEIAGEAANGEKALSFLQQEQVDLAVVDIAMPIMNGLQFIEESQRLYPDMHYVVLSFHEDFAHVQAALRLGTLDYISKMRLDQQDCVDVFKRAADIIIQLKSEPSATKQEPLTGADWKELEQKWLNFYWLYAQEAFEEVRQETLEKQPSAKKLEHLLVRIADLAKKDYECPNLPEIPAVESISEAIRFIEGLKATMLESILSKGENLNNPLCMVHAVTFIRKHLAENISIHIAAQQVGLSRSYFAANFKKIVGITFNQFLRRERVKKAKQLMDDKLATHSDVAQMVGYEDEKYFAHLFDETVGMSPAEYMQRVHKKESQDEP